MTSPRSKTLSSPRCAPPGTGNATRRLIPACTITHDLKGRDRHRREESDQALRRLHGREKREPPGPLRRDLRPAGRQWRGQNDHHQDALRPARSHHRRHAAGRRAGQPAVAPKCASASATCRRNSRSTTILSIGENLDFFAGVYGVPRARARREEALGAWRSPASKASSDLITGSLPGGWKQRVAFGASIMHEPEVLFLDEPTSGVDPLARRAFWRMINKLADLRHRDPGDHALSRRSRAMQSPGLHGGRRTGRRRHSARRQRASRAAICSNSSSTSRSGRRHAASGAIDRWRVSLFGDRLHVITDDDRRSRQRRDRRQARCRRRCGCAIGRTKSSIRSKTFSSRWWKRPASKGKVARED